MYVNFKYHKNQLLVINNNKNTMTSICFKGLDINDERQLGERLVKCDEFEIGLHNVNCCYKHTSKFRGVSIRILIEIESFSRINIMLASKNCFQINMLLDLNKYRHLSSIISSFYSNI